MGVSGDDDDDDGIDESAREMRETVVYDRCGTGVIEACLATEVRLF
jgi:hypothetical protein